MTWIERLQYEKIKQEFHSWSIYIYSIGMGEKVKNILISWFKDNKLEDRTYDLLKINTG